MADWRGALAYPFRGPERERPFVVVWILLLVAAAVPLLRFVSVLGPLASLLLLLPVVGYLLRVLAASERGEPAPPFLAAPMDLLRRAIGGTVVSLAYLAIPFVLLMVTIYGAIYTERVPDPNSFSSVTIYAGSTAVLFMSLLGAYVLPIALSKYLDTGSLRSAFTRRYLRTIGLDAAYFAGWTAAMGIFGFVAAIAAGVATATRAGPILASGLLAYTLLFTVHVWGRSLARAR